MERVNYTQVAVEKKTDSGVLKDVFWIPSFFAKKGQILQITKKGSMESGWVITDLYDEIEKPLRPADFFVRFLRGPVDVPDWSHLHPGIMVG